MDLFLQASISEMGVGSFLFRTVIIAVIAYFGERLLSGVYIKNFSSAIFLALVLSLLNATVGWLLSVLIKPLDWITFGIFSGLIALAINTLLVIIADKILDGFQVKNFWWAAALALLLSFGTGIFNVSFGANL
ncbi:MAG: phage holin family protein [Bacteroidota bacterium]